MDDWAQMDQGALKAALTRPKAISTMPEREYSTLTARVRTVYHQRLLPFDELTRRGPLYAVALDGSIVIGTRDRLERLGVTIPAHEEGGDA